MGQKHSTSLRLPSQAGKVAVVTGANSGIGYHVALQLAAAGAEVVVCARDAARGKAAVAQLEKEVVEAHALNSTATNSNRNSSSSSNKGKKKVAAKGTASPIESAAAASAIPIGSFRFELLDLASLQSIREFADRMKSTYPDKIDILVNNAGVMNPPKREVTADGFELQMGTNHLGHFALTLLLLPLLRKASPQPARVVTVSSVYAARGDPKSTAACDFKKDTVKYEAEKFYCESKLQNQLFTLALAEREPGIIVTAAHPGVSQTALFKHSIRYRALQPLYQPPADGALGTIKGCVDPAAKSKEYYGPKGWRGLPLVLQLVPAAQDQSLAEKLWVASEKATGISYSSSG